jgi:hypothetical protein
MKAQGLGHNPLMDVKCRPSVSGLCALAARVVAVSGAAVTIVSDTVLTSICVCSSDSVAQRIEDLQFLLGEGPGLDAYTQSRPVGEPDLANAAPGRWPGFAPDAVAAGAAAIFAFPLYAGRSRLGVLDLYRDRPGPLSAQQAGVVAAMIARQILTIQAHAPAETIAPGLIGEPGLPVVHRAIGMIATQLDISMGDALVRLRARAYADNMAVTAVATDVVNRQLRFEE